MTQITHEPVMMDEVLEWLNPQPGQVAVDGTLGLGGHSLRIGERISQNGILYGFDWDEFMLEQARTRLEALDGVDVRLIHSDFRGAADVLEQDGVRPHCILLDLGISNVHVSLPERGFSFVHDGPLDMRMRSDTDLTAADYLAKVNQAELEDVIRELGGERFAGRIARTIVETRKRERIETTRQLAEIIESAVPKRGHHRLHPATRTFQAIRIAVNEELEGLGEAVIALAMRLAVSGRMVVMSYHSGEDRLVKLAMRDLAKLAEFVLPFKTPLTPSDEEVRRNPKSRSAKFRVVERLVEAA